jgi:DNA mismatch endonuclease (patch repair protein)
MSDRPPAKSAVVSSQMSRMPRSSTGPEVRLRRELHARGLRFRTQDRGLPGTPDVVLSKARLAVFIDGCFWHGCPEHCVKPKNNADWWEAKLAGNTERDQRKDRELVGLGWLPVHFWEHVPITEMADQIQRVWRERTGRS